jgi:hypothetical protein
MNLEEGRVVLTPQGFSHITDTTQGHYFAEAGEMCYVTQQPAMSLLENTP